MKVHGRSWNFMVKSMDFHVSPCQIINVHGFPWKSMSLKLNRFVYEKCCVLTTWKDIDFHVNPSLAINGNEQFVWVLPKKLTNRKSLDFPCQFENDPSLMQAKYQPTSLKHTPYQVNSHRHELYSYVWYVIFLVLHQEVNWAKNGANRFGLSAWKWCLFETQMSFSV